MGTILSCCAVNLAECAACAACSCFTTILSWSLSQATRFGHLLIVLLTFSLAIILGTTYPNSINGYQQYATVDLTLGCSSDYTDECIYRQLIYRASFALAIVFSILAIASYVSESVNKGFWMLKLGSSVGLFIAFWWGGNTSFANWAELARVVSFIWLLVQGLLLLDFAHDIHDVMMAKADEDDVAGNGNRSWYAIYLIASLGFLTAAGVGLAFLFLDYAGCQLGLFFIVFTLIMGVATAIISLLNVVNKGLLTPCVMFAYAVFICWYALLSSPQLSCNPGADSNNGGKNGALITIAVISVVVLLYCVANGTLILNIFNPEGEGVMQSYNNTGSKELQTSLTGAGPPTSAVDAATGPKSMDINRGTAPATADNSVAAPEQSSGTAHERCFFHVLMVLIACYGAMILTSWGATDGSPVSMNWTAKTAGSESMWLKIISQWIFWILYLRVLQVAYHDNVQ